MAGNNLNAYDPIFYANQALDLLMNSLGMAGRIYRGYEKSPQEKGSTIQIRKPSTFSAQDAPSTAQDVLTDYIQITLNNWREVKFKLTDKDITLDDTRLISDHIAPAAYALADDIDSKLCDLYKSVPLYSGTVGQAIDDVDHITLARKELRINKCPLNDPSKMHFMVGPTAEAKLLSLAAFSQNQGAGDVGIATQQYGTLGRKYGFEVFANQNVKTHTAGTASVTTLAVVGNHSKNASTILLDAATVTGTIVAGDTFTIAGHTQRYAALATVTASGNAFPALAIEPHLAVDVADNAVVTLTQQAGIRNLAFHENFAALAMAPLSDMAGELGAKVATVVDPITNLALRSRVFYIGDTSTVYVALDVLYGYRILNGNMAVNVIE